MRSIFVLAAAVIIPPCTSLVSPALSLKRLLEAETGGGLLPTSAEGKRAVERLVTEIESRQGNGPNFAEASTQQGVNGTWRLLYSTNAFSAAGGGSLLSGGGGSSSGTLTDVEQDIDVDRGLFVNRVKLKPWPRFALGGGGGVEEGGEEGGGPAVTLELCHDLVVVSSTTPCRLEVKFTKVQRTFDGSGGNPLAALVPRSSEISVAPGLGGRGAFDVTAVLPGCDGSGGVGDDKVGDEDGREDGESLSLSGGVGGCGDVRIARGTGLLSELRIFERIS